MLPTQESQRSPIIWGRWPDRAGGGQDEVCRRLHVRATGGAKASDTPAYPDVGSTSTGPVPRPLPPPSPPPIRRAHSVSLETPCHHLFQAAVRPPHETT